MINLLSETKRAINDSGHGPSDIIFIGSEESGHSCSWKEFLKLADVEYDNGYGSPWVATDLIIVFSDGQKMWRGEYDGSEWWEHSKPFVRPDRALKITALGAGLWKNLAEINGEVAK